MHFPLMTHLLGRYLIADLENRVIFLSKMANVPYNLSEKNCSNSLEDIWYNPVVFFAEETAQRVAFVIQINDTAEYTPDLKPDSRTNLRRQLRTNWRSLFMKFAD